MTPGPVGRHDLSVVRRYTVIVAGVWTVVLLISLAWNLYQGNRQTQALAHKEAVSHFNKDQGFRLWGTKHGGVYVPISEETPPSPYMAHVPERDITAPSGTELTLLNPAYMVRQLMEDYNELYGIRGKITGLVVLRPGNEPDPWEEQALHRLKGGADEVLEVTDLDGRPYLRLMRPMYMEPGCDKCHGHLGFEEGDFRGGVGVAIPMTPYLKAQADQQAVLVGSHAFIWLLGLGAIGFGARQIRGYVEENVRAARILVESEERLRAIATGSPVPLLITRFSDGMVLYANPKVEPVFGIHPDQLQGQLSIQFYADPVDRQKLLAMLDRDGEVNDYEMEARKADGTPMTMMISLRVLTYAGEKAILAGAADISRRKRAEAELQELNEELEERVEERTRQLAVELEERGRAETAAREHEERLRTIVDNAADGIITMTESGMVETFNRAAEEIFGFDAEEIIGHPVTLLMPRAEAEAHQEKVANYLETGTSNVVGGGREVTAQRKNGQVFPLYLAVSKVDLDGKVLFSAVVRDMTGPRRAEEAMRKAKEQAEKANRAKSQFLSSMSHELRTPLNGILGFAQLLEFSPKDPLSEQQTEYVDLILQAGNHLLGLINEVLDLSKIESGNLSLSIETIRADSAVREATNLLSTLASRRGVTLLDEISVRDDLPPIRADVIRFKQVLVNLGSNAIKYNDPGGRVVMSCARVEGPGAVRRLRFSVTDTGPGIPEEKVPELFEPFNRLGQEAGEIEGSGIGLTITRRLMEMMDGRIGVESEVGVGSTFWIELPVAEEETLVERPAAPVDAPRAESVLEGRHTVLYVEDNPNNLKLMSELLGRFPQVTMITAPNAEEGLILARQNHPDVIILDINLPGMDGFEALRELQHMEDTRNLPVIALSASAMPKDIKRGLRAGFQTYLTKPLDVPKTIRAINVALESRRETIDA